MRKHEAFWLMYFYVWTTNVQQTHHTKLTKPEPHFSELTGVKVTWNWNHRASFVPSVIENLFPFFQGILLLGFSFRQVVGGRPSPTKILSPLQSPVNTSPTTWGLLTCLILWCQLKPVNSPSLLLLTPHQLVMLYKPSPKTTKEDLVCHTLLKKYIYRKIEKACNICFLERWYWRANEFLTSNHIAKLLHIKSTLYCWFTKTITQ